MRQCRFTQKAANNSSITIYSEIGLNVQEHSVSSGRRIDAHSLDVVDKINGKVIEKSHITVSADGNTQTFSVPSLVRKRP